MKFIKLIKANLTDNEVQQWSDVIIDAAHKINIEKAKRLINLFENNGENIADEDWDLYEEVCSPMMELEYPTENLENTYLPVFENGNEEQWINMWQDANCLPNWDIICKLIHIICKTGW